MFALFSLSCNDFELHLKFESVYAISWDEAPTNEGWLLRMGKMVKYTNQRAEV